MVMRFAMALIAALAWVSGAIAEVSRPVLETYVTDDSEDARQVRQVVSYRHSLHTGERVHRVGAGVGYWRFDEAAGDEDFRILDLGYRFEQGDMAAEIELRQLDGADWSPTLGNALATHRFDDRWYLEVFAERSLVDAVRPIRRELSLDGAGLSLDYRVHSRVTLVGALLGQRIDDGNDRAGGVFRVIIEPPLLPGLTLQTHSRRLDSEFDGVGYFSPEQREEHLLLVGYARAVWNNRFSLKATVGPGWQRLENGNGEVTRNELFHVELAASGWFTNHLGLESEGVCTNTGGPNTGRADDDYRYCRLQLSVIGSW